MGVEMLLNALMKMCGFTKEQFQEKVEQGSEILEFVREKAISLDVRVATIENNQALILTKLAEIQTLLETAKINL